MRLDPFTKHAALLISSTLQPDRDRSAGGSISVAPRLLISGRRSAEGWYSGTSIDSLQTLSFTSRA